jgi:hypothetical protein
MYLAGASGIYQCFLKLLVRTCRMPRASRASFNAAPPALSMQTVAAWQRAVGRPFMT